MKVNCVKCQIEYEKSEENDSIFCLDCRAESDIKNYKLLTSLCFYCGLITVSLFLPFFILPMIIGTNGSGNYVVFRGGIHITPAGLLKANIAISIISVAFFCLSAFFKRKT